MQQANKTTTAVVVGAVVTMVGALFALPADLQGAVQTLLTAALVYLIPNGRKQ